LRRLLVRIFLNEEDAPARRKMRPRGRFRPYTLCTFHLPRGGRAVRKLYRPRARMKRVAATAATSWSEDRGRGAWPRMGFLWPHRCWHTEALPGTGEDR